MIDIPNAVIFFGHMRLLKLLTISFIIPWLGSCATGSFESTAHGQPHAILKPEVTVGNFLNTGTGTTTIVEIDGKTPNFWRMNDTFRLPPGSHDVGLLAREGQFMSMAMIKFTAEAGKTYSAKSDQVGGMKMSFRIEEAPSRRVVAKATGALQLQPPTQYTPTPVFIPVRN